MTDRWLLEQFPRPMAEDPFLRRFVGIFEEIAGPLRGQADHLEHLLDLHTAPSPFLTWMAGWMGLGIHPSLSEERRRALVRAAGPLFPWRGTRRGLEGLLRAFTRSDVEIEENGGVFPRGEAPTGSGTVTIRLEEAGGIDEQDLLRLVRAEVPADATVELEVAGHEVEEADIPDEVDELVSRPPPGEDGDSSDQPEEDEGEEPT